MHALGKHAVNSIGNKPNETSRATEHPADSMLLSGPRLAVSKRPDPLVSKQCGVLVSGDSWVISMFVSVYPTHFESRY